MTSPGCHCTQGNHARSTRHGDQMAVCYWALDPHHTPSHHSLMLRSQSLHPNRMHPPPTDGCAHARMHSTHTCTLNHINDKLHAHDIWSFTRSFGVGIPSACFSLSYGSVLFGVQAKQRKAPSSPLPVWNSSLRLSTLAGLPDILASKLPKDACLSMIAKHKASSVAD